MGRAEHRGRVNAALTALNETIFNPGGAINSTPPQTPVVQGYTQTIDYYTIPQNAPLADFPVNNFVVNEQLNASIGVEGYKVTLSSGGSNTQGGRSAFYAFMNLAAPTSSSNANREYVSGTFFTQANSSDGGTAGPGNDKGGFYGLNVQVIAQAGATNLSILNASEVNLAAAVGSSVRSIVGWAVVPLLTHKVKGSVTNVAYLVSSQLGAAGLDDAFRVDDTYGAFPLDAATGTVLHAVNGTFLRGIDMSTCTISTDFIKGPNNYSVSPLAVVTASKEIIENSAGTTFMQWADTTPSTIYWNYNGGVVSVIRNNGTTTGMGFDIEHSAISLGNGTVHYANLPSAPTLGMIACVDNSASTPGPALPMAQVPTTFSFGGTARLGPLSVNNVRCPATSTQHLIPILPP